jgi:hypothetical protein
MVVLGILGMFAGVWVCLGNGAKVTGNALFLGGPMIAGLGLSWLILQCMFRK